MFSLLLLFPVGAESLGDCAKRIPGEKIFQAPKRSARPARNLLEDSTVRNLPVTHWLQGKVKWATDWMNTRRTGGSIPDHVDFYPTNEPIKLKTLTPAEEATAKKTKDLYYEYYPPMIQPATLGRL